jgi:hypothetical protein
MRLFREICRNPSLKANARMMRRPAPHHPKSGRSVDIDIVQNSISDIWPLFSCGAEVRQRKI